MPPLAQNKRARHDYNLLERFEAGLVLSGPEVKSIKSGRANLQGAYVMPKHGELWLVGCSIAPYGPAKSVQQNYDPMRDRKLLLTARELAHLAGQVQQEGLTLVPLSLYTAHRLVKLELALAHGKTRYDKRVTLRKRETEREIRRSLTR